MAEWWKQGISKLRTRAEDSACGLLIILLRQHASALDPKLVVDFGESAENKGPLRYSGVTLELVTCASVFLLSHQAFEKTRFSNWLLGVMHEGQSGILQSAEVLLAAMGWLLCRTKSHVTENTLENATNKVMWRTQFRVERTTLGELQLSPCTASTTVQSLKISLLSYLNELSDTCEGGSCDIHVILSSTVVVLIVCAVLDRQGVQMGLNSRISDFLALVTRSVENGSRGYHVFFECISTIQKLRHANLMGDSLCILWDSFLTNVAPLLCPQTVLETPFDADSASGKALLPQLRLSLLLNGPISSEPFLLALFPQDIKQYAQFDPCKRLPELFRHVGQKLLSSYTWNCSPKAKELVVSLLEVYYGLGSEDSGLGSDARDLQKWVTRDKFLVSPNLLYSLLQVSPPSEYLDGYAGTAICAAQKVESRDSHECLSLTLARVTEAKSRSSLLVEELVCSFLVVHKECLDLLPVVFERVKADHVMNSIATKLGGTITGLGSFCTDFKSGSLLEKVLSCKVDDSVFVQSGHFSTGQLLTSEDGLKWNLHSAGIDLLSVNWPEYSSNVLLVVVRGLLQLMLKPRVTFEVGLRLIQLKYVLCLFQKDDLMSEMYVIEQMVSCLISFLSDERVGGSVTHLLSELFGSMAFKETESLVADLGEQCLKGVNVSHLLSLLKPSEDHLKKYIDWVDCGFSDPDVFLKAFLRVEHTKLKATLLRSMDGLSDTQLLGLMLTICTRETVAFLKGVSVQYPYKWNESRVLGLVLGRGYLLYGEVEPRKTEHTTQTDFWIALTTELQRVLSGSDFEDKFVVEVCLSKLSALSIGPLEYPNTTPTTSGWIQDITLKLLNKLGPSYNVLLPLVAHLSSESLLSFIFKWSALEYCKADPSDLQLILSNTPPSATLISTYFFVNSFTTLQWNPDIVNSALSLHLYTEALYFLESDKTLWSQQEVQPSYYDIYQNIDDPDLFYGLSYPPGLESALMQLNHENQNLTCFEYESGLFDWHQDTAVLSHLSESGMNGLAYTLESRDVYRWKLGLLEDPVLECGTDDQVVLSQLRSLVTQQKPVLSSLLSNKYLSMQYLLYQMRLDSKSDYLDSIRPPEGILDILQFCSSAWRTLRSDLNSIQTLSKLGEKSRELGNAQISKNCAVSLQQLSSTVSAEARNYCTISIASALWSEESVSRTTPVEMLKRVLTSIQPSQSSILASQFCQATVLLTDWSSQARMLSPEQIHDKYISGVSDYMDLIPVGAAKKKMFHVFAKFCESQLQQQGFDLKIGALSVDIERLESEMSSLKRLSVTKDSKLAQRNTQKALERALEAKQTAEKVKSTFLDSAVHFYLLSCAVHDSEYHEDVTRLISLWFGHSHEPFVNERMQDYTLIPSFKLAPLINQLSSKLSYEPNNHFQTLLLALVSNTCITHPYHCLYQISSLMRTDETPQSKARITAAKNVWNTVKTHEKSICRAMEILTDKCVELANAEWPTKSSKVAIGQFPNGSWWVNGLKKLNLPPPTADIPLSVDYSDVPRMTKVLTQVTKAGGLSHPKIMDFQISTGSKSTALLKGGRDDMRQDAIMEQVFVRVNQYFLGDPETRKRGLSIRTYNVIPMGPRAGMIEFVANTESLQAALVPLHEHDPLDYLTARGKMSAVAKETSAVRIEVLEDIYTKVTPIMSQYFFQRFRSSAQQWFKARTNYVRSTAASSILGYILGIGDRHCNNIMIDNKTGQLVHIDLGISFDQGKNLNIPEKVPFRLTRDMVDAMGSVGVDGPFRRCCELSLELFRQQQDNIMSILNVLQYDPLYLWTISPKKKLRKNSTEVSELRMEESNVTAAICLSGVEGKLEAKLSTEAVVRELINEATSVENLAVIFHGWTPFY